MNFSRRGSGKFLSPTPDVEARDETYEAGNDKIEEIKKKTTGVLSQDTKFWS